MGISIFTNSRSHAQTYPINKQFRNWICYFAQKTELTNLNIKEGYHKAIRGPRRAKKNIESILPAWVKNFRFVQFCWFWTNYSWNKQIKSSKIARIYSSMWISVRKKRERLEFAKVKIANWEYAMTYVRICESTVEIQNCLIYTRLICPKERIFLNSSPIESFRKNKEILIVHSNPD